MSKIFPDAKYTHNNGIMQTDFFSIFLSFQWMVLYRFITSTLSPLFQLIFFFGLIKMRKKGSKMGKKYRIARCTLFLSLSLSRGAEMRYITGVTANYEIEWRNVKYVIPSVSGCCLVLGDIGTWHMYSKFCLTNTCYLFTVQPRVFDVFRLPNIALTNVWLWIETDF